MIYNSKTMHRNDKTYDSSPPPLLIMKIGASLIMKIG